MVRKNALCRPRIGYRPTPGRSIQVPRQERSAWLTGLRDRVTSATGRKIPYLIGSVDASLLRLADKLQYVNTEALVASIRNLFT